MAKEKNQGRTGNLPKNLGRFLLTITNHLAHVRNMIQGGYSIAVGRRCGERSVPVGLFYLSGASPVNRQEMAFVEKFPKGNFFIKKGTFPVDDNKE